MAKAKKTPVTDEFQEDPPRGVIGDNSEAETTAFLKHQRAIIVANEGVAAAAAVRQRVRKLAKADGIVLKHMDAVILMSTWEPAEVRDYFGTLSRYAIMARLPVGTTVDLFDGVSPDDLKKIDWRSKGFIAATTGKGAFATPPGDCPPDQVQEWMAGWSEGQEANAGNIRQPEAEESDLDRDQRLAEDKWDASEIEAREELIAEETPEL